MSVGVAIKKKGFHINVPRVFLHIFFVLFSLSFIVPMLLVVSISFTDESALRLGYSLWPKAFSISAYQLVFKNPQQIIDAYMVTAFTTVVGTVLSILIMSMVGYALSRRNFRARNAITFFIYFTMLFSGGLIPTYILNTSYLHMGDTIWIYIIPSLATPFNIIVFTSFFRGLPHELVESAKIDGASELRIYWNIIVPLSKPVIATLTFLTILGKWNDWYTSLIYIRAKTELYTLQYLLQRIFRELDFIQSMVAKNPGISADMLSQAPLETMQFAMAIIATGPMLFIFPFFQKYLARGLTIGAVKG